MTSPKTGVFQINFSMGNKSVNTGKEKYLNTILAIVTRTVS